MKNVPGFDREAFEHTHDTNVVVTSVRLNPGKLSTAIHAGSPLSFTLGQPVPWSRYGYYLDQRPSFTFDPLFHAGLYYVQEASSMFLEQAMKLVTDTGQPLKVLDLSAAPGGKSTHLQSLLPEDSLLVSNEVIRSRCAVLTDNIIKWGASNVIVTNNDPAAFKKLTGYFDVIVVDAPCSGSGLFRKDPDAMEEWSLNNVSLCSQRQQRILADVYPALKENGLLIYSTCSYSMEEDEAIADWLVDVFHMESLSVDIPSAWGIVETQAPVSAARGYRFYPDKLKGEGFFMACFRKCETESEKRMKSAQLDRLSVKDAEIIKPWLSAGMDLMAYKNEVMALPYPLVQELSILATLLNIYYAGVRIGSIMKQRLVPDHALAVNTSLSGSVAATELNEEEAIKYLQRNELSIQPSGKGWQVVRYKGYNLGWINALPNRINNYYPKEIRILKQSRE
jgi:16S rRNA C967 or C1407 C5-methylase (RsmB/RsmF family)/NOL1/NOP2/fmu family ribosome biogenesis protein